MKTIEEVYKNEYDGNKKGMWLQEDIKKAMRVYAEEVLQEAASRCLFSLDFFERQEIRYKLNKLRDELK